MGSLLSLYDYLGHAAGGDLGKKVARAAVSQGININTRYVDQGGYKGDVMLYPKTFLDNFFGGTNENKQGNKQLLTD